MNKLIILFDDCSEEIIFHHLFQSNLWLINLNNFSLCGLKKLIVVSPRESWPNFKTLQASANSKKIIKNAKVFYSLEEAEENEEDYLDKAWGLEPESRLSCQALITEEDLVIEIPKYTINMVSEDH